MDMVELKKLTDYSYELPKTGNMLVPGKLFLSDQLLEKVKGDHTLEQVKNMAGLPGIKKAAIAMPDAHCGYGFCIGGVAAFDSKEGIISPGGVGFDINCGVRLVATNLTKEEVEPKIKELLDLLFQAIPTGKGYESKERLTDDELNAVLSEGSQYLLKQGIGSQDDVDHCESSGKMDGAKPSFVSSRAHARGRKQLGTLGAGNHFLEIQVVDEIFNPETAKIFGITQPGQVVFMIHCGSRGLGHQVASDYLRKMEDEYPEIIAQLPEKDLIYAPIQSKLAKEYYGAMCAAANFAWANRHMIAHKSKEVFKKLFAHAEFNAVYDVAHNIAKKETHDIDGVKEEVVVHRKGATRAFGPGQEDLPEIYHTTGQPVLIPGSMGTASYVLVGTTEAMNVSFGSTAHGAGRIMSRLAAKKLFQGEHVKEDLAKKNIELVARSIRGVGDEAPGVYKDVDEVVKISHDAKIGNLVAKVKPLGVIKG
jgi:tRNA-splicing ligase RtcB (3'-phosphate/5'-hydroxy nucleic acid ligase)